MRRFYAVVEEGERLPFTVAVDGETEATAFPVAVGMVAHNTKTPFDLDLYGECQICGREFAAVPISARDPQCGTVVRTSYGAFVGAVHHGCYAAAEAQADALYAALGA